MLKKQPLTPETGEHLNKNITQFYNNLDTSFVSFPADDVRDAEGMLNLEHLALSQAEF